MHPSLRFTIAAVITVFAGIAFASTWVHAVRSDPDDRGSVPEIVEKVSVSNSNVLPKNSTSSPADYPLRLRISSLGIDANVQRVGLTAKGNMGIPSNFTDAGWYARGPAPGDYGNALIDGHVDNALGLPGVFSRLGEIRIGDTVTVISDDGTPLDFTVTDARWYNYADVPMGQMIYEKDKKRLKLITCGGTWIQSKKMYDQRLVVTAILKE